jgi:hypothetical protein
MDDLVKYRHGKHSGGAKRPAATPFAGQQQIDSLPVNQAKND